MEKQFTQGEWLSFDGCGCEKEMIITTSKRSDDNIVNICEMDVFYDGEIGVEQVANMNLIAAAPNGFDLGLLVMELCGQPHGIDEQQSDLLYETALSFIKKARGETP